MSRSPSLNWFGGMLVARHLLEWYKAEKENGEEGCFIDKMNKINLLQRVAATVECLQAVGPTLEAAQKLQEYGWFATVSAESIVSVMQEAIDMLNKNGIWKFRKGEFGTLDFSNAPGFLSESERDGCDCGDCSEETDKDEDNL